MGSASAGANGRGNGDDEKMLLPLRIRDLRVNFESRERMRAAPTSVQDGSCFQDCTCDVIVTRNVPVGRRDCARESAVNESVIIRREARVSRETSKLYVAPNPPSALVDGSFAATDREDIIGMLFVGSCGCLYWTEEVNRQC